MLLRIKPQGLPDRASRPDWLIGKELVHRIDKTPIELPSLRAIPEPRPSKFGREDRGECCLVSTPRFLIDDSVLILEPLILAYANECQKE